MSGENGLGQRALFTCVLRLCVFSTLMAGLSCIANL